MLMVLAVAELVCTDEAPLNVTLPLDKSKALVVVLPAVAPNTSPPVRAGGWRR